MCVQGWLAGDMTPVRMRGYAVSACMHERQLQVAPPPPGAAHVARHAAAPPDPSQFVALPPAAREPTPHLMRERERRARARNQRGHHQLVIHAPRRRRHAGLHVTDHRPGVSGWPAKLRGSHSGGHWHSGICLALLLLLQPLECKIRQRESVPSTTAFLCTSTTAAAAHVT